MRIMSNNIWGDYFNNPVELRENKIYSVFRKYDADIIGFQEVTENWYSCKLFDRLCTDYTLIGTEKHGINNFVPIAFKNKYMLRAKGFEYLDCTTDKSKAVTWGVFFDNENSIFFAVCNTHFWWKSGAEHDKIRIANAKQLSAIMTDLQNKYNCPVFAFGDMNCVISSDVFKIYGEHNIIPLYSAAENRDNVSSHHGNPLFGKDGCFHGHPTEKDHTFSIDHIVAIGDSFTVSKYGVVQDADALDVSDHSPIYSDISFIK